MTQEILQKFLNNACSEAELQEVIHWAKNIALSEEGKKMGFESWEKYQINDEQQSDEKFSLLFDKIQQKIDANQSQTAKSGSKFMLYLNWMSRVAAILLIPVLAFLFYTLSEKRLESNQISNLMMDSIEVVSPIGSRTVVQLSDGSVVHLNYGSKLKYPQVFAGETREVKLQGEGFFEVAHNPEKPFVVKTEKLNVKALGTVFNVLAYADNNFVETTLVNGKVVLEQNLSNGKTLSLGAMVPGQHVDFYIESGKMESSSGNIEKYLAWKDGKMVFEDATITEVAKRLSRVYNVEIEISEDIKDYLYTVTFIDEPLFQILDLMAIATPVKYKALPRKKLADGTFSKQKVIISKRQ